MLSRWYSLRNTDRITKSETAGISDQEGWTSWKNLPVNRYGRVIQFIQFLALIHEASDIEQIKRLVFLRSPKIWHRFQPAD